MFTLNVLDKVCTLKKKNHIKTMPPFRLFSCKAKAPYQRLIYNPSLWLGLQYLNKGH